MLVGVQARGGGADQRVGAGAQRHDHGVHIQLKLAAFLDDGAAAAGSVRFAQLHLHTGHAADPAVRVAQHLHRVGEGLEDDALLLGVLHFLPAGRQFGHAAAVDDVDGLGPQPLGAAGGVHGDVAAAHDGHRTGFHDGGMAVRLVGFHQVDPGQVLVGRVDALEAFAGDPHKAGQAGAGGDVHRLEAVFAQQFVDGQHLADDHVAFNVHTQLFQAVHFLLDDVLGQTELGDAVHQHAARHMQGFVDGDLVAHLGQVAGGGQAGRPGADHRDLAAVGGRLGRRGVHMFPVPVGHEPLQPADADGFALDAPDALALALILLRADAAADGRQRAGPGDDLVGGLKVALGHLGDKAGDVDVHRAAGTAGVVLALQAALGFLHGHLGGVAQGHLLEVLVADVGVLAGHGTLFRVHVGHLTRPPS